MKPKYTVLWCLLLMAGIALLVAWSHDVAGTRTWLCFGIAAVLICGSIVVLMYATSTPHIQPPQCRHRGACFQTSNPAIGSLRPHEIDESGRILARWGHCNSCAGDFEFTSDTEPLHP